MIIIKKYFEYIGMIGICLLSFYYTEKVALYVKDKNPIMQTINSLKEERYVDYIDSQIIDDLYIIPGLNGKEINSNKSYSSMQEKRIFNESQLVFNEVKPTISIEDNKDKIIIRGNNEKNSVSLIFESINNLTSYMHENNYLVDVLLSKEEYNFNYELINNASDSKTYSNIDKYLNKNKRNKNLCITFDTNINELCKGKYIVKPSLTISHTNISSEKNKISSGEIILIKDSLSLTEFNIILNFIKYHDLNIVPLSELISENNNFAN